MISTITRGIWDIAFWFIVSLIGLTLYSLMAKRYKYQRKLICIVCRYTALLYHSLMKEGPWVVHLTLSTDRGR